MIGAVGAPFLLRGAHEGYAHIFLKLAVVVGFISTCLLAVPTDDMQAKMLYRHQPVSFAAM